MGGQFRTFGSVDCDNLAVYDGTRWWGFEERYGFTMAKVTAMTVHGGKPATGPSRSVAVTVNSVEVSSDVPVLVTARTYNQGTSGTFGQYLPGADAGQALASGQLGVLPQIKNTSAFRTNVGFVNLGTSPSTVRVRLYSAAGGQLGSALTRTLNPGEWKQISDVYAEAGTGSSNLGMATVEVVSGDGPIWAYASVVDNTSNDPTTVPVFVQ